MDKRLRPREPEVKPDYVLKDLTDLPAVVERWRSP